LKTFVAEKKPEPEVQPQPTVSDAASVPSVASPGSTSTPMEGVEQAPSISITNGDPALAESTIEKQEPEKIQPQVLVAPVV